MECALLRVGQQNSSSSAIIRKTDDSGWGGGGVTHPLGRGEAGGAGGQGRRAINRRRAGGLGGGQRDPENSLLLLPCVTGSGRVDGRAWSWLGVAREVNRRACPPPAPPALHPAHARDP